MTYFKALIISAAVLAAARAGCPYAASKNKLEAFSSFTGQHLTEQQVEQIENSNTTTWCLTEVAPCDSEEGRRVDGSCANPRYPPLGHGKQQILRMLPAEFGKDGNPRPPKSNRPQPLFRQKRKLLVAEGRVEDLKFTHLLTNAWATLIIDMANIDDETNYLVTKPYCCKPEGKLDKECAPNAIPDDDSTMRFSTQRCINMTRPITFQKFGCLSNSTDPEWINSSPPLMDLSMLYGETLEALLTKGRKFEGGLLKYEVDDQGIIWPPSSNSTNNTISGCLTNEPGETRCHDIPFPNSNSLLGINMFVIWLWRHHNVIASELAERNPCWDDERLFYTARDINIAMYQQMMHYEMLAEFMGRENLIKSGVLSESPGFRDLFDDSVTPQLFVEAPYVMRWIHTIQNGELKFYDESGNYMKSYPIVNMTLHTGFLDHDKNLQGLTQGSFRQGCGKLDHIADPDMMTIGFGPMQDFLDILTNDISKAGYFGLPPYTKYREFCSGNSYKSFDDLGDHIAPELEDEIARSPIALRNLGRPASIFGIIVTYHQHIATMKDLYGDVLDVELIAGIWLEKYVKGGHMPVTFYCIFVKQLQQFIASDQHWYERPNRPKAFTLEQLLEVRKSTVAQLLCDVGDTVTEIQPRAFLRAGPGNEITSCDNIQKVNFDAWIDPSCTASAPSSN